MRKSLGGSFRLSLILIGSVGLSACAEPAPMTEPSPPPDAATREASPSDSSSAPSSSPLSGNEEGLDLSFHSGAVDWSRLAKDGHGFVFLKATEGMDLRDPSFEAHWAASKAAGLLRGAYHFYVTEDDPGAQAELFTSVVSLEPGDFAPVVDIEVIGHDTPPGLPGRLRKFLDLLEAHYGIRPIIYTAPNFWNEHLEDSFGDYPLWVAEYDVEEPRMPVGWQTWHLWQWKGNAPVPGVENEADLDRVNRSGPDLSVLTLGP